MADGKASWAPLATDQSFPGPYLRLICSGIRAVSYRIHSDAYEALFGSRETQPDT